MSIMPPHSPSGLTVIINFGTAPYYIWKTNINYQINPKVFILVIFSSRRRSSSGFTENWCLTTCQWYRLSSPQGWQWGTIFYYIWKKDNLFLQICTFHIVIVPEELSIIYINPKGGESALVTLELLSTRAKHNVNIRALAVKAASIKGRVLSILAHSL